MAKTPGLGLTLPVRGGSVGYFNTAYLAFEQIKSNLTNLILTKKGERIMLPTFGCDIHNLVFEHITDDIKANAKGAIQSAVQQWMPFVTINDIQFQKDENNNRVYIKLVYSLSAGTNQANTITLAL